MELNFLETNLYGKVSAPQKENCTQQKTNDSLNSSCEILNRQNQSKCFAQKTPNRFNNYANLCNSKEKDKGCNFCKQQNYNSKNNYNCDKQIQLKSNDQNNNYACSCSKVNEHEEKKGACPKKKNVMPRSGTNRYLPL